MSKQILRKYGLIFLKYCPFILALTCVCKIWLFYLHNAFLAKIVNVILNTTIVLGIYCLGRTLGYCQIHRFLSYFTLFGYFWYSVFLIFEIPYYNVYATSFLILYTIVFLVCIIKFKLDGNKRVFKKDGDSQRRNQQQTSMWCSWMDGMPNFINICNFSCIDNSSICRHSNNSICFTFRSRINR